MNRETKIHVAILCVSILLIALSSINQTQKISDLENRVALIEGPSR